MGSKSALVEVYSLYDGRVQLTYSDGRHLYTVEKKLVPSVTGITGMLDNGKCGALQGWAVNQAIDYLEGQLVAGASYDEIAIHNMLTEAKGAYRRRKTRAAQIGDLVHAWAEKRIKAKLGEGRMPGPLVNEAARGAAQAFLDWEKQHEVEYIMSEQKVLSLEHWYAGTLDIVAYVDGELALVDLKTSNSMSEEYCLQTAAYVQAFSEEYEDVPTQRWIVRVDKRTGELDEYPLHLLAGDTLQISDYRRITFRSLENDIAAFLGLRQTYRELKAA